MKIISTKFNTLINKLRFWQTLKALLMKFNTRRVEYLQHEPQKPRRYSLTAKIAIILTGAIELTIHNH